MPSVPRDLIARKQKDIEMQSERRGERHRPVALVAADVAEAKELAKVHAGFRADAAPAYSLLRLSVPARLVLVAIASALLWGAVLWALR
jgi:hypothetical protein